MGEICSKLLEDVIDIVLLPLLLTLNRFLTLFWYYDQVNTDRVIINYKDNKLI